MIRRQPLPHVRRQQEPLLTTALNEVLRHTAIVLNASDGTFARHPLSSATPRRSASRKHIRGHTPRATTPLLGVELQDPEVPARVPRPVRRHPAASERRRGSASDTRCGPERETPTNAFPECCIGDRTTISPVPSRCPFRTMGSRASPGSADTPARTNEVSTHRSRASRLSPISRRAASSAARPHCRSARSCALA